MYNLNPENLNFNMNKSKQAKKKARYSVSLQILNEEPTLGIKIINSKCQEEDGTLGHVQGFELGFFFFTIFFMRIMKLS